MVLALSAVASGRDSTRGAAVCHVAKNEVESTVQSETSYLVKEKKSEFRARREVQARKPKNPPVFRTLFQMGSAVKVRVGSRVMCIRRELSNNCIGISCCSLPGFFF